MNKQIIIFYHIFANGNYKKILDFHINELKQSGLYASIKQINFGLIYHDKSDLYYIENLLKCDDKLNLHYARKFDDLPIKPISSEPLKCKIQLGEGETIMKMVEFCKSHPNNNNHIYLFLHTKGASMPDDKSRRKVRLLLGGFDNNISAEELRMKIIDTVSHRVIRNWKNILYKLNTKNLYYLIWNFFWVNGSLLKEFDTTDYFKYSFRGKQSPISQNGFYTNRHCTATFPLGLYEQVNKKQMFYKNRIQDSKNIGVYF